ncbi:hypothetical protein LshimejAT787_0401170 [Lyophyllum shimeji]|uniref:CBM1 domain-containing protein n=1 Tax=Lyophyllum shimeji TaxID=47721 RepID=A0A9P3PKJ6_LYOSH|nr:hypothetical protein LshimejAT787_0401170 [Lyophyllum shimeji]
MKSIFAIAAFVSFLGGVSAQSPAWGQCGGQGWSGPTTCVAGYTCTYSNPYYSQCLPGSGTPPLRRRPHPRRDLRPRRAPRPPNNGGTPMLGPESSSGYFTIGSTISLTGSGSGSQKLYLNIDNSGTQSYKALMFGTSATTTDWGLEGDTIITTAPRQLNFLACQAATGGFWNVWLQTGNDTPAGKTCAVVTMHLPCLC